MKKELHTFEQEEIKPFLHVTDVAIYQAMRIETLPKILTSRKCETLVFRRKAIKNPPCGWVVKLD